MCFVWISEQTTTISLYNINWLVFNCAVPAELLQTIQVSVNFNFLMDIGIYTPRHN